MIIKKNTFWNISFQDANPKEESKYFNFIFKQDKEVWENFILKIFPDFAEIYFTEEQNLFFDEMLTKLHNKYRSYILSKKKILCTKWETIHNPLMNAFKSIFNISINNAITVSIGLNIICPRNIEEKTFSVPFYFELDEIIRICAHEISHFFYFEKIKKIDPDIQPEKYNSPHEAWILSEIIAPIILNDKRVRDIIGSSTKYSYVCSKELSEKFDEIYSQTSHFREFYKLIKRIEISSTDLCSKYTRKGD